MKKILISLFLVLSLFTLVACGNNLTGKYVIDSVEITGLDDLADLFGEMEEEEGEESGFSIVSIFNSETLTEILVETGAYIEFKENSKVDIGTSEGVQETYDYEIKNGKIILKKNGTEINPLTGMFGDEMEEMEGFDLEELGITLDFSIKHNGDKVTFELSIATEEMEIEEMEIPAMNITIKLVFKK